MRISQDRLQEGLGVERQEEDCRKLCERLGWDVAQVFKDNDVSAYSGKARPAWNRLVHDVQAGAINAIAVWHLDRLTRSLRELEDVIDLADLHHLKLATVSGDIDLATPSGRMMARTLGNAARYEAEHKAERQRRQRRQEAEMGKPSMSGSSRPFGYEKDRITVRPDEAAIIREAARRILARETLSNVCRDFHERGITNTQGGSFKVHSLRRMLASARISGRREYKPWSTNQKGTKPLIGEITADAVWDGIISVEDSDRLRALLVTPPKQPTRSSYARKYMLSGILRCEICGNTMSGRPKGSTPRYVCPKVPGTTHCGKIATVAIKTDEFVRDVVLTALASPNMTKRLRARGEVDPEVPKAIAADEALLEELAEKWANHEINSSEWSAAKAVIQPRLDRNLKTLAQVTETTPLLDLNGDYEDLLERWEKLSITERRAVILSVVDHITCAPADTSKKWDPERFTPAWKI